MTKNLAFVTLGSAIAMGLIAAAMAGPVTTADLSGKKICWSNGNISSYGAGGKFSSNRSGNGTWAVTSLGVEVNAEHGVGHSNIEKMADGTFKATFINKKGLEIPTTGSVCN